MTRRRLCFFFAIASLVACGSRTGLFGPEAGGTTTETEPEAGLADVTRADAPPDGPVPCVPGRFNFQLALAQLMFVIDRSGSMDETLAGQPAGGGDPSRWQVLHDALAQTLTGFDQDIAMGAKFFPNWRISSGCLVDKTVDFEPQLGNAAKILHVFDTAEPNGGTPTADALRIAADHVSTIRGVARTLVLATDGAPNCNYDHPSSPCVCTSQNPDDCSSGDPSLCLDDDRTVSTIRDIFDNEKVPVYVIGIGTQESAAYRQALDQMAIAGGRPKPTPPRYYSAETPAELGTALSSIRDSVGSCTFLTPSAPTDPDAIVVEIEGQTIARDTTRTNGWDWVDQAYGTLAFFGAACAKAQAAAASVAGVVRCN